MTNIKNVFLSLIVIIIVIITVFVFYKEIPALKNDKERTQVVISIPDEAKTAAEEGLPRFKKYVSEREQKAFNFASQEEINYATLGEPFRVYTIRPEELSRYNGQESLYDIISPTNYIFFPVIANETIRTILTVGSMDGVTWKATGMGHSGLAKTWASINDRWPSSEYDHIFIRVYQKTTDFILFHSKVKAKNDSNNDGVICIQMNSDEIHNPSDPLDMKAFLEQTLGISP